MKANAKEVQAPKNATAAFVNQNWVCPAIVNSRTVSDVTGDCRTVLESACARSHFGLADFGAFPQEVDLQTWLASCERKVSESESEQLLL